MKINIHLKEVLKSKDLDKFGVIQQMSKDLGINRRTISKLYNNQAPTVSLDVLGKISTWLKKQGFATNELLGLMFGTQPSKFWESIGATKTVTIYLGEYQQTEGPAAAWRWVSRRDSMVAALCVQQLSASPSDAWLEPQLRFQFIPFRYAIESFDADKEPLAGDIKRTREIFRQMKSDSAGNASILIGSQKVNYLLEYFVADLFGCKPFVLSYDSPRVPFFTVYRQRDRKVPSCCAGTTNPYNKTGASIAGLHYIGKRNRWIICPWEEREKDAGLVITVHYPRSKATEVAILGFSGKATEVLGDQLILKEHLFWPPKVTVKGREIGIYVCRLQLAQDVRRKDQELGVKDVEIISLDEKILGKYLR